MDPRQRELADKLVTNINKLGEDPNYKGLGYEAEAKKLGIETSNYIQSFSEKTTDHPYDDQSKINQAVDESGNTLLHLLTKQVVAMSQVDSASRDINEAKENLTNLIKDLILNYGANPLLPNTQGQTAFNIAYPQVGMFLEAVKEFNRDMKLQQHQVQENTLYMEKLEVEITKNMEEKAGSVPSPGAALDSQTIKVKPLFAESDSVEYLTPPSMSTQPEPIKNPIIINNKTEENLTWGDMRAILKRGQLTSDVNDANIIGNYFAKKSRPQGELNGALHMLVENSKNDPQKNESFSSYYLVTYELIMLGANPLKENAQLKTPIDLARDSDKLFVLEQIKKAGEDKMDVLAKQLKTATPEKAATKEEEDKIQEIHKERDKVTEWRGKVLDAIDVLEPVQKAKDAENIRKFATYTAIQDLTKILGELDKIETKPAAPTIPEEKAPTPAQIDRENFFRLLDHARWLAIGVSLNQVHAFKQSVNQIKNYIRPTQDHNFNIDNNKKFSDPAHDIKKQIENIIKLNETLKGRTTDKLNLSILERSQTKLKGILVDLENDPSTLQKAKESASSSIKNIQGVAQIIQNQEKDMPKNKVEKEADKPESIKPKNP